MRGVGAHKRIWARNSHCLLRPKFCFLFVHFPLNGLISVDVFWLEHILQHYQSTFLGDRDFKPASSFTRISTRCLCRHRWGCPWHTWELGTIVMYRVLFKYYFSKNFRKFATSPSPALGTWLYNKFPANSEWLDTRIVLRALKVSYSNVCEGEVAVNCDKTFEFYLNYKKWIVQLWIYKLKGTASKWNDPPFLFHILVVDLMPGSGVISITLGIESFPP